MTIAFSRCFAMPNAATFSIKPIGEFVKRLAVPRPASNSEAK